MELRQIEYFVRVAELGSFTRASIALDVAQPALSRQVRLLEQELRQTLLLRNGRGVTTTEAGRVMLEQGRGVLHQLARVRDELARLNRPVAGSVALGLPPSLSKQLAVPLVRLVAAEMPDLRLSLSENLTTALEQALASGQLDLALLYNPTPRPDIDNEFLREEALFVVTRRVVGRPPRTVLLPELAERPLVIPRRPNALRMLIEHALAQERLVPCIALEADGVDTLLGLVANGLGDAVLGASAIASITEPERYTVNALGTPPLHTRIHMAWSAQRSRSQAQRTLMQIIRSRLDGLLDPASRLVGTRPPDSWP